MESDIKKYIDNLFVIRHGSYSMRDYPECKLSERGILQMERLGKAMKEILNDENVTILTTTATRGMESVNVLKDFVNIKIVGLPFLYSDRLKESYGFCEEPDKKMINILKDVSKSSRNIGILSHFELLENFPAFFSESVLGKPFDGNYKNTIGKAAYFDIKNSRYQILPDVYSGTMNI
ncbi:MAG: hypothetical protein JW789_02215 [Candidatus Aenigmarchaeota archaeon]|nr:hypothetical protein [Candidatus Aenigmarchaeota archaeon]